VFAPGDEIEVTLTGFNAQVEVIVEFLGPAGQTGPTGPTGADSSEGFMKAHVTQLDTQTFNVTSVVHAPGSGIYDFFLTTSLPGPLFTAGAVVTLGVEGISPPDLPVIATYQWMNPGFLRVNTWTLGAVPIDPFGISVDVDLI
jgi:hypothetical protein